MAKKSKTQASSSSRATPKTAPASKSARAKKTVAPAVAGSAGKSAKKAAGAKKRAALALDLPLARARKLAGDLYQSAGLAIWAAAIESSGEAARAELLALQDAICDAADLFKAARATNPRHLALFLVACYDGEGLAVTPPRFVTAASAERRWKSGARPSRAPSAAASPARIQVPPLAGAAARTAHDSGIWRRAPSRLYGRRIKIHPTRKRFWTQIRPPPPREARLGPVLRELWPYVWPSRRADLRLRIYASLVLLVFAKLATIAVPYAFKWATDALAAMHDGVVPVSLLAGPVALTMLYGALRIVMAGLTQARDALFAAVAMNAVRRLAMDVFVHLHALSMRFHLERKTGALTRVLERGRNAIETLTRMAVLNALPTALEFFLILVVMVVQFGWLYAAITAGHHRALPRLYRARHQLAHRHPPLDERKRFRRQRQGDRLAAQLRDGQVFRRRDRARPNATTAPWRATNATA